MATNNDNLDYAASQAVDGVLSDFDALHSGDRLASAEGRAMAAGHERLNALLRSHDPLPPVDFDGLAASISTAIRRESAHVPAALPMRPTWTRRLAYAAAVGLIAAAAWPLLPHRTGPAGGNVATTIEGPSAAPTASGTIEIRVGPSDVMKQRGLAQGLGTGAATPEKDKPRVVITSASAPSEVRPY